MDGNDFADILKDPQMPGYEARQRWEFGEKYWEDPLFQKYLKETPKLVAGKEWESEALRVRHLLDEGKITFKQYADYLKSKGISEEEIYRITLQRPSEIQAAEPTYQTPPTTRRITEPKPDPMQAEKERREKMFDTWRYDKGHRLSLAKNDIERWDIEVHDVINSKEYQALPSDQKLKITADAQTHRQKLVETESKKQEKLEKKRKEFPDEIIDQLITATEAGEFSEARLADILRMSGRTDEDIDNILDRIPDPMTEKEKYEIKKLGQQAEQEKIKTETQKQEFKSKIDFNWWLEGEPQRLEFEIDEAEDASKLAWKKLKDEDKWKARADLRAEKTLEHTIDIENKRYELNVKEFDEETALGIKNYNLAVFTEKSALEESLWRRGFDNQKFIRGVSEFYETLEETKAKRREQAKQFGITEQRLERLDAQKLREYKDGMVLEWKKLDLQVKELGLNEQTERRIATMAMLEFDLAVKEHGLDIAIQKFKEQEAGRGEWWAKLYYQMDNAKAQAYLRQVSSRIVNDAKRVGLEGARLNLQWIQFRDSSKRAWLEATEDEEAKLEIPAAFVTDLDNNPKLRDEVVGWMRATYNPETKKIFTPNDKQWQSVYNFLYEQKGEHKRSKEELGINLAPEDFFKEISLQPTWKPELKGYAARCKYNDRCWKRWVDVGLEKRVYISEEVEGETTEGAWGGYKAIGEALSPSSLVQKGIKWLGWGKKEMATSENIGVDFSQFLTLTEEREPGMEEARGWLRGQGYTDSQIDEYFATLAEAAK